MGKQSRRKKTADQPSPEEFQMGLDRAAAWAGLRASDKDLAELADLVADASFLQAQASLRSTVQRDREALVRTAAAACDRLDWHLLIILIEGYVAIQTALRQFLPGAHCTEQSRRDLFVTWLIVRARQHGQDPAALLRLLNAFDVLGPHAIHRAWVDAHRKLGVLYGVIPIMQAAAEAQEPGAAAQLEDTLDALVKLSRKHLPPSLKQKNSQEVRRLVRSALGEVLVGRVHPSGHPLEAAIRGFNGKFEVMPEAVANVVSKDEGYRAITVAFTAADDDHLADESPSPLETLVQEEQGNILQKMLAWIETHPTHKSAYAALVKEQTQAEAAREAGISERTLRDRVKALRRDLGRTRHFFSRSSGLPT